MELVKRKRKSPVGAIPLPFLFAQIPVIMRMLHSLIFIRQLEKADWTKPIPNILADLPPVNQVLPALSIFFDVSLSYI